MKTPVCRVIDPAEDPRRAHFAYFRGLPNPFVGVTVQVDVTALARFCRERGVSFYLAFIHAAALAADGVPEFRRRIRGDDIVEYDACGTSHTEPRPDGTYGYCTLHHHMPFADYLARAEEERERCRSAEGLQEDEAAESLYFISCLPWLHYTSLIQPTGGGDESNPRITWGRYEEDFRGRLMLPVTTLCHHALVDGIHLAAFYQKLNEELARLTE